MKLFITGATGFVGTHVVARALAAGHVVTALRRPGSQPRLPLAQQPRWVEGEMDEDWRSELNDVDVLVHLAAHTANPPYDSLPACLRWNVTAPVVLAEQARELGVKKVLIASSCFEYGGGETAVDRIPVDAVLAPNNAYASSKAAASVAFMGWAREHAISLQVLRVFHVFGAGEPVSRFWPALHRAALSGEDFPMTSGAQVRDFVCVDSVASQFVDALDFSRVNPGCPVVVHVASGRAQTLLEFAQYWWEHWGATGRLLPGAVPYRNGEVMRLVPELVSS